MATPLEIEYLGYYRDTLLNRQYNDHDGYVDGSKWPPQANAVTMAGQRRIDHMVALLAVAVEAGVPGSFIETGVWRGGISFMAAKTLDVLHQVALRAAGTSAWPRASRLVYLCDSFSGIPNQYEYARAPGRSHLHPPDNMYDRKAHTNTILNRNSLDRVQADARRFHLDTSHLRFEKGFFNESLPALLRREADAHFAIVRLDGDTYWSTYEALELLYPRLSPGGFLIIDDYVDWLGCRQAVHHYRKVANITAPIALVPHTNGETVRGAYWRKPWTSAGADSEVGVTPKRRHRHDTVALSSTAICVGAPPSSLRLQGSHNPQTAEVLGAEGSRLLFPRDPACCGAVYRCV